jgi:molybdopterin-guanine dinucleotide biosynthesis protein A
MLTVSIQAGGQSRRMGQDKALMPFLGRPLIQRVVERMMPIAAEIIVTTNQPAAYAFLGLPLFPDLVAGRGALGGLYTALSAAQQPFVAVVACDMPFASPELLQFQAQRMEAENADVVIPAPEDGLEPLHAVYRRATCLPAIQWALENDLWKLIAWFPKVKVREVTPEEIRQYDPRGLAFANVNTPEELLQAESLARTLPSP